MSDTDQQTKDARYQIACLTSELAAVRGAAEKLRERISLELSVRPIFAEKMACALNDFDREYAAAGGKA